MQKLKKEYKIKDRIERLKKQGLIDKKEHMASKMEARKIQKSLKIQIPRWKKRDKESDGYDTGISHEDYVDTAKNRIKERKKGGDLSAFRTNRYGEKY